jgi:hypothetical protein
LAPEGILNEKDRRGFISFDLLYIFDLWTEDTLWARTAQSQAWG